MRGRWLASVAVLVIVPAFAQESASFRLNEWALNAGGRPQDGAVAASASYRISIDAVADPSLARDLGSASFRMDGGFAAAYPPPGEATGLGFADRDTLTWDPERSAGRYQLYRDPLDTLPGSYGACLQRSIEGESWVDSGVPSSGGGWFYLVTAENRLGEEGSKGYGSGGAERPNSTPCP